MGFTYSCDTIYLIISYLEEFVKFIAHNPSCNVSSISVAPNKKNEFDQLTYSRIKKEVL